MRPHVVGVKVEGHHVIGGLVSQVENDGVHSCQEVCLRYHSEVGHTCTCNDPMMGREGLRSNHLPSWISTPEQTEISQRKWDR